MPIRPAGPAAGWTTTSYRRNWNATLETPDKPSDLPPAPPILSDEVFRATIIPRTQQSLRLAQHVASRQARGRRFTRPLLGEILHQAAELEELFDACGARNNSRWRLFRSTVAAAKLFANVCYELIHIRHSAPAYRLLDVEGDFGSATAEAIGFVGEVLIRISRRFPEQAAELGIPMPDPSQSVGEFDEDLPPGRLAHDQEVRRDVDAAETVTYLATAFLKQAAESDMLHVPGRVHPSKYAECVPRTVSEEQLRQLQYQFHNLQSMYDTFVAETDTERNNRLLPVLRGHVSVIFHLLVTATLLAHYYERHVMLGGAAAGGEPLVSGEAVLNELMRYSLTYASRYLLRACELCREMLKRYAEIDQVEVPGPRYRGFHVRPSTLVAKIVHHYGSDVTMVLGDGSYDASSPMDIFRANEKINREKRRWLATNVTGLACTREPAFTVDLVKAVKRVILELAEQGKVVIYQRNLPVEPPEQIDPNATPMQVILEEVKRLQTIGAIDMEAEIRVTFVGDKRVLNDLQLLAECGYGEDNFGNNIPLPKELSYLRR